MCVCVFGGGGFGGVWGGLINCPKVLMCSACSESRSFHHTVAVPRFTTVVYCLFSLGEIVCWFS